MVETALRQSKLKWNGRFILLLLIKFWGINWSESHRVYEVIGECLRAKSENVTSHVCELWADGRLIDMNREYLKKSQKTNDSLVNRQNISQKKPWTDDLNITPECRPLLRYFRATEKLESPKAFTTANCQTKEVCSLHVYVCVCCLYEKRQTVFGAQFTHI